MSNKYFLLFLFSILFASASWGGNQRSTLDSTIHACSGLTQRIGVSPSPGYTYLWSPFTGLSSVDSSFTRFTLNCNTGTCNFNYQLQIIDSEGALVNTIHYIINVSHSVSVEYNLGSYDICLGDTAVVEAPYYITPSSIPSPPSNYSFSNNGSEIRFWPEDSTTFYFTNVDFAACYFDITSFDINVKPKVVVQLTAPDTVFCYNDNSIVQLNYSPLGGYFFGSGINQTGQYDIIQSGPGVHTITYSINPFNCPSSASINLEVVSDNIISLDPIPNYCRIDTTILFTQGTPQGGEYFIDSIPVSSLNPSLYEPGIHYLGYKYQGSALCAYERVVPFFIIPLPARPSIQSFPANYVCEGNTITLTSSPFTNYLWNTNATTSSITVAETGTYSVQTISNTGCYSEPDSIDIIIAPPFTLTVSNYTYPNGYDMSSYQSNDGEISISINGGIPPFEVTWEGVYGSELTYSNLAEDVYNFQLIDAAGCVVSDSARIVSPPLSPIIPSDSLFLPNAFTPNGDGFNDFYVIKGLNEKSAINSFTVWDIKRQEVFSAKNYSNNWDGKSTSGSRLPAGTYYAVFVNNKNE
ncbi:MAG: hypothetical protein RLZZ543_965, partial [Bacteroidota bacterium]